VDVSGVRARCLAKPGARAERPFGPDAVVMKVGGRIFAIIAEDARPAAISLKCEPELASVLRETYPAVVPGYHLDKRHWNTVTLDGSVPDEELAGWIDDSYDLVVDKLPRHVQRRLGWTPG
jgi:predicted DNA-binding protein (MmcQ/YjbR family)